MRRFYFSNGESGERFCCFNFCCSRSNASFLLVAGFRLADFLRERADLPVEKLVAQFQRHVGELRFGIGNFPLLGHGLGDEAALLRRFATVEKFREVVPGLVLLRGEAQRHNLPDERMQNPVHVQMQRGGPATSSSCNNNSFSRCNSMGEGGAVSASPARRIQRILPRSSRGAACGAGFFLKFCAHGFRLARQGAARFFARGVNQNGVAGLVDSASAMARKIASRPLSVVISFVAQSRFK